MPKTAQVQPDHDAAPGQSAAPMLVAPLLSAHWPAAADAAAAGRLIERFTDLGTANAALPVDPTVTALLACIGGNSPFLSDLALREAAALAAVAAHGPDAVVQAALRTLRQTSPAIARAATAAILRRARRQVALATAIADIGGLWRLDRVTAAMSDLADAALAIATGHLLRAAHDSGALHLPHPDDPARGSGLVVLALGKLGGRELNYSSDVDLMLLYDPGAYSGSTDAEAMGTCFTRLTRNLVTLMEARDADGYVFRVDLRLRPDPSATSPAIALPAAIAYYESMGQNWERAAMIKARPVAGDLDLGHAFLREIRPFIWRRHLDFAAIADIHAMKRRIDTHKGGKLPDAADPPDRVLGHNLKLGEGGIREIEFLAQTLQLVWGGRDPGLRATTTLGALRALARAGHLPRRAAAELASAYRFLRGVEHRLQMVADRQTHTLPERAEELARFATFMGYATATAFARALLVHLQRVRRRYGDLFVPSTEPGERLDFRGRGDPELGTIAALEARGFSNPRAIIDSVRGWQAGRVRALRSQRSRDLMEEVLPHVLDCLARQPQPDAAFIRFDAFLSHLPAGVQPLSLFQRNPALLDRVLAVLGAAPPLADHLARYPNALEGLLWRGAPEAPATVMRRRLREARLLEDVIAIVRRTVREEDFAISVATLEGWLDADEAGMRRTDVADAALATLLGPVLADFERRHGRVRGGQMAMVAMGKAGGREMMAGSDLDLMLIYDHPEEVTESTIRSGTPARKLAAGQWFVRAAHALVAAITAPGADGPMYQVDMRLRPSGNKGPVAVSLAAFVRYHAESAWTWERLALTRARVVAGPPGFVARVRAAISEALATCAPPAQIHADTQAMRARMDRDLPPDGVWDVKHRAGGMIDVEFIAQMLQLIHGGAHPAICSPTTRDALAAEAACGLLPEDDAALLIRADRVWRSVQGMLRITVGRGVTDPLPDIPARALARALVAAGLDPVDVSSLRATLDAMAGAVRAAFLRHVGGMSE